MNNFRELNVWQKSIDFVTDIYLITKKFPKEEIYGLTSQIRRSAISIPSNISEGAGRSSNKEFIQFLSISLASSYELETQLSISKTSPQESKNLMNTLTYIQNMIIKLKQSISNK